MSKLKKGGFQKLTLIHNLQTFYQHAVDIFGLLFLYQLLQNDILATCVVFAVGHLIQVILTPFAMQFIGKQGTRTGFILAIILHITALIPIIMYAYHPVLGLYILWYIVIKIAHVCYYPTRIYLTSELTSHKHRGVQMSYMHVSSLLTAVATPLIAGWIMHQWGFEALILVASVVMTVISIPTLLMPNYTFTYHFHSKQWNTPSTILLWKLNLITALDAKAGRTLWVIFIFTLVAGSYKTLGIVLAIATGFAVVLMIGMGRLLDKTDRLEILSKLHFLSAITHIAKAIPGIPILLNDTFDRLARGLEIEASSAENYDLISDEIKHKDEDEKVVIREITVNVANATVLLGAGISATLLGLQTTFILLAIIMIALNRKLLGGVHFRHMHLHHHV